MTQYFFHLNECGEITPDSEGRDLPDHEAARRAAIQAARAIMCEEISKGEICFSCQIDITDEKGRGILKVPFTEAVKVSGLPPETVVTALTHWGSVPN